MTRISSLAPAILLIIVNSVPAFSATCSCAGTPLMGALNTSTTERGDLYVSFVSEYHEISDLVQGRKQIDDETDRTRSSLSQSVAFSYGLSDRWALSGLLSYIEHEREVGSSFLGGRQQTSGLGDSILMLRYTPIYITPFSSHELAFGIGARLPTGKNDAGGIISFSEDMQPGSGAAGGVLWAGYSYAFNQAATRVLTSSVYYTKNDEENTRKYVFGDEFVAAVAFTQNLSTRVGYSLGLRYRHADHDQRLGFPVPTTGGQWLDFTPTISFSLNDNFDVNLSGRIPLIRDLEGAVQFTTSYAYALSIVYSF